MRFYKQFDKLIKDENGLNTTFFILILTLFGVIIVWALLGPFFDGLYFTLSGLPVGLVDEAAKEDAITMYYWFGVVPLGVFIALLYFVIKRAVDVSKGFKEDGL